MPLLETDLFKLSPEVVRANFQTIEDLDNIHILGRSRGTPFDVAIEGLAKAVQAAGVLLSSLPTTPVEVSIADWHTVKAQKDYFLLTSKFDPYTQNQAYVRLPDGALDIQFCGNTERAGTFLEQGTVIPSAEILMRCLTDPDVLSENEAMSQNTVTRDQMPIETDDGTLEGDIEDWVWLEASRFTRFGGWENNENKQYVKTSIHLIQMLHIGFKETLDPNLLKSIDITLAGFEKTDSTK